MDTLTAALVGVLLAQLVDLYWPDSVAAVDIPTEDPMTVEIWERRLLSIYG